MAPQCAIKDDLVLTDLPGLLFVWTHVDEECEGDFNSWYDQEHMEERVRTPGQRSGRVGSRNRGAKDDCRKPFDPRPRACGCSEALPESCARRLRSSVLPRSPDHGPSESFFEADSERARRKMEIAAESSTCRLSRHAFQSSPVERGCSARLQVRNHGLPGQRRSTPRSQDRSQLICGDCRLLRSRFQASLGCFGNQPLAAQTLTLVEASKYTQFPISGIILADIAKPSI